MERRIRENVRLECKKTRRTVRRYSLGVLPVK